MRVPILDTQQANKAVTVFVLTDYAEVKKPLDCICSERLRLIAATGWVWVDAGRASSLLHQFDPLSAVDDGWGGLRLVCSGKF